MSASEVQLLLYDNHYDGSAPLKATDLLYRSANKLGVPFRSGSLVPASERPWSAGDREEWLLRTLPSVTARIVVLLDASDAVLFCDTTELAAKWRMLAGRSASGRPRVLIGVEQQMWPEEQYYIAGRQKAEYPRAPMGNFVLRDPSRRSRNARGTPFRFINIGMLAGPPAEVHGLLRCMQERYPGFPRQCPGGRLANGSYEWFSNAPHRTRFGIFSGHWGWEQSCFHNYYFEQLHGELPPHCPELALDYGADVILNLKKSLDVLVLGWQSDDPRPRLNDTWIPALRDVRPCVLHANSATKAFMPILQLFWERAMRIQKRGADSLPPISEADVTHAVGPWHEALVDKAAQPCHIGALGAGLSMGAAFRACLWPRSSKKGAPAAKARAVRPASG